MFRLASLTRLATRAPSPVRRSPRSVLAKVSLLSSESNSCMPCPIRRLASFSNSGSGNGSGSRHATQERSVPVGRGDKLWDRYRRLSAEATRSSSSSSSSSSSGSGATAVPVPVPPLANPTITPTSELETVQTPYLCEGEDTDEAEIIEEDEVDPEVKDAQIIFQRTWKELEQMSVDTSSPLTFPKEIIWLMGAPGAGKGTQTPFIIKHRQMTTRPIEVSKLLESEEQKEAKFSAVMVSDGEVFQLLLKELLRPEYKNGCVVDGFPRTEVQVELLKMFHAKMEELHETELHNAQKQGLGARADAMLFPRPLFRITVLYVGEKESVRRQLARGRQARQHNEGVMRLRQQDHGLPDTDPRLSEVEVRPTDLSEELARKRYITFIEHFSTLKSLVKYFPYHLIDSEGSIEDIEQKIDEELKYQSHFELDTDTYEIIRQLPLATTITDSARRDLVSRLDNYVDMEPELFSNVVNIIETDFLPVLKQHALSGKARIKSDLPLWSDSESAVSMVIDILSERGFRAFVSNEEIFKPYRLDAQNRVLCHSITRWEFQVEWQRPKSLHDNSVSLTT